MNIFQLADNDQAQHYLGVLFGNVGIALQGTGSSVLGNMFKTFNTALLVVGTFFIVYITIVGVMTSAHEGEFMKKWNSLWTPLRMLIGIVALFPTNSGYCAIQVVMMWLILQGVGAADMVWKTTVDYVANGGSLNPPSVQSSAMSGAQMTANMPGSTISGAVGFQNAMSGLFGQIVCQSAIAKFTPKNAPQYGDEKAVGHSELVSSTEYDFGVVNGKPDCGKLTWDQPGADSKAKPGSDGFRAYALQQGLGSAYTSLVPIFEGIADAYIKHIIDDPNCWPNAQPCTPTGSVCWFNKYNVGPDFTQTGCSINGSTFDPNNPDANSAWNAVNSYAGSNFYLAASQLFAGYANNYLANAAVAASANQQGSQTTPGLNNAYNYAGAPGAQWQAGTDTSYTTAETNGWIFAGAFYYYMAYHSTQNLDQVNKFYSAINVNVLDFNNPPDTDAYSTARVKQFYIGNPSGSGGNCTGGACGLVSIAAAQMNAAGGGNMVTSGGGGPSNSSVGDNIAAAGSAITATWMNNLTGAGDGGSVQNPIVNLQYFGKSCLIAAETLFWSFLVVTVGLGILQTNAVLLGNTISWGAGVASALLSYFMPVVFFFILYLISIGGLLGVYVPLLPFTLFTFGVIGWFTAVIEAMVAAPIIALGILSPGGQHEILGRAEPAVMIILNVIMRPVLMIFGMIAALLLSYVVIYLINGAFLSVVVSITGSGTAHAGMGLIESFLFIMAYASLVVTAISKCFELIHVIPSKALRYIGGQAESYGEAEAAEKMRGAVSQGGEVAGGAAKGVGDKGAGGGGELAKARGDAVEKGQAKGGAAADRGLGGQGNAPLGLTEQGSGRAGKKPT